MRVAVGDLSQRNSPAADEILGSVDEANVRQHKEDGGRDDHGHKSVQDERERLACSEHSMLRCWAGAPTSLRRQRARGSKADDANNICPIKRHVYK